MYLSGIGYILIIYFYFVFLVSASFDSSFLREEQKHTISLNSFVDFAHMQFLMEFGEEFFTANITSMLFLLCMTLHMVSVACSRLQLLVADCTLSNKETYVVHAE